MNLFYEVNPSKTISLPPKAQIYHFFLKEESRVILLIEVLPPSLSSQPSSLRTTLETALTLYDHWDFVSPRPSLDLIRVCFTVLLSVDVAPGCSSHHVLQSTRSFKKGEGIFVVTNSVRKKTRYFSIFLEHFRPNLPISLIASIDSTNIPTHETADSHRKPLKRMAHCATRWAWFRYHCNLSQIVNDWKFFIC